MLRAKVRQCWPVDRCFCENFTENSVIYIWVGLSAHDPRLWVDYDIAFSIFVVECRVDIYILTKVINVRQ